MLDRVVLGTCSVCSNQLGRGITHQIFIFFFGERALTPAHAGFLLASDSLQIKGNTSGDRKPDGSMPTSSNPLSDDLNEKSLLHLHTAAYTLLPASRSLSSYLGSNLLAAAVDNDINLPTSYTDTRLCPRCGTLYLPGVTCTVRTAQSRRQKRTSKRSTWVIYDCAVCKKSFRMQAKIPEGCPHMITEPSIVIREKSKENTIEKTDINDKAGKKRRRGRLHGLRDAIEKAKTEKESVIRLDLQDLMKVD